MARNETIGLENTHGLIGDPIEVFNKLGPDVQEWIVFIVGLAAFVFLIITLISFFAHGAGANVASVTRNSAGRTHHVIGIISGILTLLLVIITVALAFAIYF